MHRLFALVAALVLAGCASLTGCTTTTNLAPGPAAITPTQYPGAQYLVSNAPDLSDGDTCPLLVDSSGNLKTNATVTMGPLQTSTAAIGSVSFSVATVDSDVFTGLKTSNGTTKVTLVASSPGKTPWIRGNFYNLGASTRTVKVYSMPSGQVVLPFRLPADPGNGSWDWVSGLHGIQGESLVFDVDAGGGPDVIFGGTGFYK